MKDAVTAMAKLNRAGAGPPRFFRPSSRLLDTLHSSAWLGRSFHLHPFPDSVRHGQMTVTAFLESYDQVFSAY